MDQYPDSTTFPELAALIGKVDSARAEVMAHLTLAIAVVENLAVAVSEATNIYDAREEDFRGKLAEAVELQKKHKSLLDENARLNAELKAAEQQLSALSAKLAESEGAEQAFQDARDTLKALVMDRRDVLTQAADQVAGKSSALLKARLKKDPAPVEYCDGMNALMDRAAVHDASERCTAWIKRILHDDPDGAWDSI
jgi:chromosome segregation ATPase